MTYHSNFQFEEFPTPYLSTHVPKEADVIIVGGGLAGLLTLYFLTVHGKLKVYLLEEGALGYHASGRDIGTINLFDRALMKKLLENPDTSISFLKLLKQNHDALNQLITNEGLTCDYNKSGGIYAVAEDSDLASLRTLHETIEKKLPNTMWSKMLDASETALLTASSFFKGSLYVPNDAVLSPYKLIHALANLCDKGERRILTNAIVENVTQTQSGINIHVRNRGVITTKHVVYCTGVYTGKVVPGVNKFLLAHKQHVIVTERLSEKLLARLPRASLVFNDVKIKATDDRVFVQGFPASLRDKFYDGEIDIRLCQKLRKVLQILYPEIGKSEIQYVWSTINCSGVDGLPISGEIHNRPREYVNIGFGTSNLNGIILSSAMIKDMIVGNETPEQLKKLFDPRRINNV